MTILMNFIGVFFFLLMVVLVGVPFGLWIIMPLMDKIVYSLLVIACIALFILGIKRRTRKVGKFLILFSLWCWFVLSLLGFGAVGA